MKEIKIDLEHVINFVDDGSKRNILIVDDDDLVLNLLKIFIKKFGYNPILAKHTDESIALFKRLYHEGLTPDLILMDIKMPFDMMNGIRCAEYLKSKYDYDKIIYMSGFITEEDTETKIRKSGKICLAKPFDTKNFEKTLREFFLESNLNNSSVFCCEP